MKNKESNSPIFAPNLIVPLGFLDPKRLACPPAKTITANLLSEIALIPVNFFSREVKQ